MRALGKNSRPCFFSLIEILAPLPALYLAQKKRAADAPYVGFSLQPFIAPFLEKLLKKNKLIYFNQVCHCFSSMLCFKQCLSLFQNLSPQGTNPKP